MVRNLRRSDRYGKSRYQGLAADAEQTLFHVAQHFSDEVVTLETALRAASHGTIIATLAATIAHPTGDHARDPHAPAVREPGKTNAGQAALAALDEAEDGMR